MILRNDKTLRKTLRAGTAMTGALAAVLLAGHAFALPVGGQVVAGQAAITQAQATLDVNQSSNRAILNWLGFDIGSGESVNFNQPSSSSITLNRVSGSQNPSQILGDLTANGQVWLVNSSGVVFGQGAQVNVGGLVATSSDIDNSNFMSGNYTFNHPGNANALIANQGSVTIADGGLAALAGPNVSNSGIIQAKLGKVALASGDSFTLDLYGDGLINLQASPAITQQIVNNSGVIAANGGKVKLTAAAGSQVVNSLINMSGLIQADSIGSKNGKIVIYAEGSNGVKHNLVADKGQKSGTSTVVVSGTLEASGYGSGQTGGSISVLGDNVGILSGSIIDASGDIGGGTIKIGGDFHGAGNTPTALNTYVDANALIMANANTSGNGGNVTVWADNNTWFLGNIMAEGGVNSGNGGYVETSGHGNLTALGNVDLLALNGEKGTYLLDPTNISIYGGVTPAFNSSSGITDGTQVSLSSALQLWLDASDTSNVTLTYSPLTTGGVNGCGSSCVTATGSSGQNTITTSSNIASSLVVGERIQLGGSTHSYAASVNDNASSSNTYTITAISGTTVTLDANLASTYSAVTLNGGYVSQLTDKSGNSNNATQGTASAMPLWISNGLNSLGVAQYNGSSDYLILPASVLSGASTFSLVSMFTTTTSTNVSTFWQNPSIIGINTSGTGSKDATIDVTNGRIGYWTGLQTNNDNAFVSNSSVNSGSGHSVIVSNNGTNAIEYLDGSLLSGTITTYPNGGGSSSSSGSTTTTGQALNTTGNPMWIGSTNNPFSNSTIYFPGTIPETIIYNTSLSTNATNLIQQYQSAKWGIALTGPGNATGESGLTGAEAQAAMASTQAGATTDGYSVFAASYLNRLSATSNIILQSSNNINLDLQGNTLSLTAGKNITLTAGNEILTDSTGTITTSNGSINFNATNGILFNNAFTLNSGGGAISLNNAVTLGAAVAVNSSGGAVNFASTVNGANNLTVNAGTAGAATFSGIVGGSTGLGALSVTAGGGINVNAVTAASINLDSSGGSGNIASNNSGLITATSGTITLNSGNDIDFSNIGQVTTNQSVSDTATGNAYLNAINSGTGSLTVNANNVYLYGGGLASPTSLVAYYNLNEGSGTTATDDSGNGNTGTINGATYSSTVPGALSSDPYSLSFNGTSNYVNATSNAINVSPNGSYTLAAWMLFSGANANSVRAFSNIVNTNDFAISIGQPYGNNTHLAAVASKAGVADSNAIGPVLTLGTWYDVVGVFSGNTVSLYVNGVFQTSTAYSGTVNGATANAHGLSLGDQVFNGSPDIYFLNGKIDDARIYNTALSAQDISNLYAGIPQWNVGTANITATNNITTNIMGTTLTAGAGKNITMTAGGSIINSSPATVSGSQSAGSGGNITLTTNGLTFNTLPAITTNGMVTIDPDTASTTVGVAGGAGTLAITSNLLNDITAGNIVIGSASDSAALTVGAYSWNDPVTLLDGSNKIEFSGAQTLGANSLTAVTASGNIVMDQNAKIVSTASSGNSIILASGGNFLNNDSNDGTSALSPGSGSARYLVYSTNPASNTMSSLSDAGDHFFNQTFSSDPPASVSQSGNLFLYSLSPTITVTANNQSMSYGGSNLPTLTYTLTGFVDGDTSSLLSGSPTISTGATAYNGTAGSGSNAGNYTITAALNNLANTIGYSLATANGTLTVNPASLTITANNQTRLYGAANPTFSQTLSGLVNGDTQSAALTGTIPNGSSSAVATTGIGNYTITGSTSGLTAGSNYTLAAPVNGTLTINPATLIVTANNQSMTYGGGNPSLTDTITGYQNSEGNSVLSGSASITTNATTSGNGSYNVGSGTWTITAGNGTLSAANYIFGTPANGTLTVNPATLTVTAGNQARTYGAANPTFSQTLSGLVNGDTQSAALTGTIGNGSSSASATTGVGAYTITGSTAGLTAGSNYTLASAQNGTLTINPATLTVTADGGKSMTYGAPSLPTLTDTITGYQNGEGSGVITGGSVTLSTAATPYNGTAHSASNVGSYDIDASGNLTAANYTFTYADAVGGLTVNPATLTVTAGNQARTYGAANPTFSQTLSGLVNGDTQSQALTGTIGNGSSSAVATTGIGAYTITGSTAGLTAGSNYTLASPVGGTLTINPATLTVTADGGKSMTYGAPSLPTLTDTITGYQNGEGSGVITGGSVTLSTAATPYNGTAHSASNVGSYDIDASGNLTAANYTFTYADALGGLTVNPATLTVTASNQARTYGAANPTFSQTLSGLVNGDTQSQALTGTIGNGSSSAVATTGIGAYTITGSTAGLTAGSNYTLASPVGGTLTINPATLTVTADGGKSMTYGAPSLPTLTDTITGYQNGEGSGVITGGSVTLSTAATAYNGTAHSASNVGSYDIDASGNLTAANYTFTYADALGGLTVNPATLTVTASNQARTYGAANPTFSQTLSGLVNGDTQSQALTGTIGNGSSSAVATTGVGAYTITGSTAGLTAGSNYTLASPVGGTLTINPATLTVTADGGKSMTYGSNTLPTLTDTITGYQNGEGSGVITGGSVTLSTAATPYNGTAHSASNVGSYDIDASGNLTAANYTFTYADAVGGLTVNPATLTVTAGNQARTYGAANPTFSQTLSGLVNGDTQSQALTGTIGNGSSSAVATTGIGAYTITGSTAGLTAGSNYTLASPVGGTLTINPATLIVTANNQSMTYGGGNPSLTDTITGYQNSEGNSVLSGSASITTNATTSGNGSYNVGSGTWTITAGNGTLSAANYIFGTPANGTLTVNPATLTVTAGNQARTYGAANPTFSQTLSGLVNGDTQSAALTGTIGNGSSSASATTGVGAYTITGSTAGLTAGSNYTLASAQNGTLTINPATLTVTADGGKSMTYGAPSLPTLTDTITGYQNGEGSGVITGGSVTLSTAATPYNGTAHSASNVGSYDIDASGNLTAANYTFTYADAVGGLTVNPATLTVTAGNQARTYGAANPTFSQTLSGLVNGDTQSQALTGTIGNGSSSAVATTGIGAYTITGSTAGLTAGSNYTLASAQNGTLTINPATLTVTADGGKSMTYGAPSLPTLTDTITGYQNGEGSGVITGGSVTLSTAATPYNGTAHSASNVGSYDIDASGNLTAANYTFTYADAVGGLTVNPATLTVTAGNQARTYGAANPTFSQTLSGLVNGDTQSQALTGTIGNGSSSAVATTGIGAYTITGSTAGLTAGSNYTLASPVGGTLTINPATLTVTADGGKSMTYGAPSLPTLTDTITGYQNGEGSGVITGGSVTLSTAATPYNGTAHSASNVGSYDIDASGNLTAANYTFTYADALGGLTVNPATLTVTAGNQARTYGAANPTFSQTLSGLVNGDTQSAALTGTIPNGSSTASATTGVGNYTITGSTAGLTAGSNYTLASPVNGTLTINPATLTVTADNQSIFTGNALPPLTASFRGLVNGDSSAVVSGLSISTMATSQSSAGSYPIVPFGAYAANYTISFANGVFTVNPEALPTSVQAVVDLRIPQATVIPSTSAPASNLQLGSDSSSNSGGIPASQAVPNAVPANSPLAPASPFAPGDNQDVAPGAIDKLAPSAGSFDCDFDCRLKRRGLTTFQGAMLFWN